MIPIRDTIPAQRTAWVVRLLVLINVAVFVFELRLGQTAEAFVYRFGVVPAYWTLSSPADLLRWPSLAATLISSQFLHGSLLHVGFNMLYLWIFGDNVEDRLGSLRFLGLYLGSGVVAAVTQLLLQAHPSVPMIGASGAIAGVLGAYFLLFPFARIVTVVPLLVFFTTIEVPAFVFLGIWFFLQWVEGMTSLGQVAVGGVAWWAHVGGFVAGILLLALLRPARTSGRRGW